jgi:Cellulose binding domain
VTAGASGRNGWSAGWTFPGNVSYNGTLAAGVSTTFGFTVSYTGDNAAPTSFSCT